MAIVLDNITYTYGMGTPFEKTALRGVSLTIENGEFLGVIGHTGSGKSTFVQHLNGLLHPTTGTVTVNGVDISASTEEAKKMRHKVGMVFQYPEHQLFEETIAQDIAFGPKNLGLSADDVDERVRDAMKFVGLDYDTYAERSPFHLSGGQMRRVAIAGVDVPPVSVTMEYLREQGLDVSNRVLSVDDAVQAILEGGNHVK